MSKLNTGREGFKKEQVEHILKTVKFTSKSSPKVSHGLNVRMPKGI